MDVYSFSQNIFLFLLFWMCVTVSIGVALYRNAADLVNYPKFKTAMPQHL